MKPQNLDLTDMGIQPTTIHSLNYELLEFSADAIIFADQNELITFWNKKAEALFGFTKEEIIGKPIVAIMPRKGIEKHMEAISRFKSCKTSKNAGKLLELEGLKKDGSRISIEISMSAVKKSSGCHFFSVVRDISKRVKVQKTLYHQAVTDPLTGMYNRRHFDKILKSEFERANRYRRSFSVIVVDIDGLKTVNDLYGHKCGDDMLIKAKNVFNKGLRKHDIAFRYGGDEFSMILPETTKEYAIEVAERLRLLFLQESKLENKRVKLSLSIGLASFPEDGKNENTLIGAADRRMYHSKSNGGNIVTAYSIREMVDSRAETLLTTLMDLTILMEESRLYEAINGIYHSQKTRSLTMEIGQKLKLSSQRIAILEEASMLHDIGMLYISKKVIAKKDPLNEKEREEVKKHPLIGEEILKLTLASSKKQLMEDLPIIVAQHHEQIDGNGYPGGLTGDRILIESRILMVADCYVAMASERPYHKALKKDEIVNVFRQGIGVRFDPEVVKHLFEIEGL